jgi:GNAT superfamily N-acetyltransferase
MTVSIRPLQRQDVPTLLTLIDGLAEYERLDPPDAAARERLAHDAFADPPLFWVLLAEVDGVPVGYAFFFFTYSTFLARPTLYLEDIFVLPDWRGHGAGFALFRACVEQAVTRDCGRMDWQVLSWNEPSIKFYERLGARQLEGWLPFRLDGEALNAFGA